MGEKIVHIDGAIPIIQECFCSAFCLVIETIYERNLSKSTNGNESNENNARYFNTRKVLRCLTTNCKVQYNFNMGIRQTKQNILCIYAL